MIERSRRIPQLLALGTTVQLGIATLVCAVECNDNCDPDAGECTLTGKDCNDNGVDDAVDIVNQSSEDCNLNRIPDECGWVACSAQASMISRGACPRFARTCHAWAAKGQA